MHLGKVHIFGSLLLKYITMHGPENVKFVNAQQAKQIYQYKNIKEKLWYLSMPIKQNKYSTIKTSKENCKICQCQTSKTNMPI